MRVGEEKVKKQIQECVDRARQRPLLIQGEFETNKNQNLAKIKAAKSLVKILKSNGLNPRDHLSEEQTELLAEHEYIQSKAKQYGK